MNKKYNELHLFYNNNIYLINDNNEKIYYKKHNNLFKVYDKIINDYVDNFYVIKLYNDNNKLKKTYIVLQFIKRLKIYIHYDIITSYNEINMVNVNNFLTFLNSFNLLFKHIKHLIIYSQMDNNEKIILESNNIISLFIEYNYKYNNLILESNVNELYINNELKNNLLIRYDNDNTLLKSKDVYLIIKILIKINKLIINSKYYKIENNIDKLLNDTEFIFNIFNNNYNKLKNKKHYIITNISLNKLIKYHISNIFIISNIYYLSNNKIFELSYNNINNNNIDNLNYIELLNLNKLSNRFNELIINNKSYINNY